MNHATNPASRRPRRVVPALARGVLLTVALVVIAPACEAEPEQAPVVAGESAASAPEIDPDSVDERSETVRAELAAALVGRGPHYVPRTRHLREDGSPRFTNRLIRESSPYLLQHAHNPVDWYPWGPEAFAAAKRLDRPIFLSIGYSTCHWCHVMEEESFEDLEIAAMLNGSFVPIKVDREERPDLDAVYMAAVQAMTGRGGWPMSSWLTPEGEPFYGGTYFPPRDGDRGRSTGFLTILRQLDGAWRGGSDKIATSAEQLTAAVRQRLGRSVAQGEPPPIDAAVLGRAAQTYQRRFDKQHGGMEGAPKFPSSFPVRFVLREALRQDDAALRTMALRTLDSMASGGIHDQVGGGFHRYATDSRWLVPHFEKMLYDNARLAIAYVEAFQLTGAERHAEVAGRVLDYVAREMTSPGGGFYSATDADSAGPDGEREEGLFFTWTPDELRALLGKGAAARVAAVYGVTPGGNFEGRSILHRGTPFDEVASLERTPAQLRRDLARALPKMYASRARRPAPLRDDKILAAWNGLMIEAMARGAAALERPDLARRAARAADFSLDTLVVDGRLHRSVTGERLGPPAFLDDHAFLIAGLLALFETGGDPSYLEAGLALQAQLDERFADEHGGYFMTAHDHETLLAREKPAYDGAEPSGNSLALSNLLRLHELTGRDEFRSAAERLLAAFAPILSRSPTALSEMLLAVQFRLGSRLQVVLAYGEGDDAQAFRQVLRQRIGLDEVVAPIVDAEARRRLEPIAPIVRNKVARDGRTTAYVCRGGTCKLPTTDVGELRRQLEETAGTGADLPRSPEADRSSKPAAAPSSATGS